jgi:YfiH family protein
MSIPFLRSSILSAQEGVQTAMSMRGGNHEQNPLGVNLSFRVDDNPTCVEQYRREFFGLVGLTSVDVAIPDQVHSAAVQIVDRGGMYDRCDALITSRRGLGLVVTIADCVPILLYDTKNHVIASVHAGWRGSAEKIVRVASSMLKENFETNPKDLVAWIGPSAGPCCYEVGRDVATQFTGTTSIQREEKWYLDLKEENRNQLLCEGLLVDNLECSTLCTICSPTMQSYRRDGERSGRMMAIIVMTT